MILRIMLKLREKIKLGENMNYTVPDLWNCFGYDGIIKKLEDGRIYVNPYRFYHDCIKNYILKNYNDKVDYNNSLSQITKNYKNEQGYFGGDWIKKSSIYSMHVRTSTSWDHDESGELEDFNKYGLRETGTFLKSLSLLPLMKKMGINTIYLLPISEYSGRNRKGDLGSPYAVKSFMGLDHKLKDPILGDEFTVEDEFRAFVEACHILNIRVMIDIIPRTAARDNELIIKHPEWFYWIKLESLEKYCPPAVEGVGAIQKPSFENINLIYKSLEVIEHMAKFSQPPDIINKALWKKIKKTYYENKNIEILDLIEENFKITTAPAFADCINDVQPSWDDVTFLKLYLDHPIMSKKYIKNEEQPSYILFDTIKSNIFKGEIPNIELWNMLSDIIPHYQEKYAIDGARIDMGHALPEELVRMILNKPRMIDKDFAFIAEELQNDGAEKAIEAGYNTIIGYGWWMLPRIAEYKTHEFMYCSKDYKSPVFACAESPDTPRIASRKGGKRLSKLLTIMDHFVPNAIPFMTSGQEIYELQPMNTGLDAGKNERFNLPEDDPFYGKLAFFDKYQLHWGNTSRWDIPNNVEAVAKLREEFVDSITNVENFVPIDFDNMMVPAIGLSYIIQERRNWEKENIIIAVCNTDLYNEKEHKLHLNKVRKVSNNYRRKAWLAYSTNEWCHEVQDFDDENNLVLRFEPGEVKIIIL